MNSTTSEVASGRETASSERTFAALVTTTAVMVFIQAIIAGQFVSQDGKDSWITVHGVIADVTWVLALLTAAYGVVKLRALHPRLVACAAGLFVALLVQTGIGHLITDYSHDWLIAVHVPLAFAIFAGAIALAGAALTAARRSL